MIGSASSTVVSGLVPGIAALIGSVSGRIWDARSEAKKQRELIASRYLCVLRNVSQTLASRLRNLYEHGGRHVMSPDYFRISTLYAFACPLAVERMMLLDGIMPQMDVYTPQVSRKLAGYYLDQHLKGFGFHRYYRTALAECAMVRETDHFRLATYREFRQLYDTALANRDEWVDQAHEFIDRFSTPDESDHRRQYLVAAVNELANLKV